MQRLLNELRASWLWVLALTVAGALVAVAFQPSAFTLLGVFVWVAIVVAGLGGLWLASMVRGRRYADLSAGHDALARFDYTTAEARFARALESARRSNDRERTASALAGLGATLALRGDRARSVGLFAESLELLRAGGDRADLAKVLLSLSADELWLGRYDDAARDAEEALLIARSRHDRALIGSALNSLGGLKLQVGDYAEARTLLEESLTLRIALADRAGAAYTLGNLGLLEGLTGDVERGTTLLQAARERFASGGDRDRSSLALANLGFVAARIGLLDRAEAHYRELLAQNPEPNPDTVPGILIGLSLVAAGRDDWTTAVRLLACADAERERTGLGSPQYYRDAATEIRRRAAVHLDVGAFAAADATGTSMSGLDGIRWALAARHPGG